MSPSAANTVLVIPRGRSAQAFISTLPHPQTSLPSQYLVDPEKGISEFTNVSAPKGSCHSWLIERNNAQREDSKTGTPSNQNGSIASNDKSSLIIRKPKLFIATVVDPMFFVISALSEQAEGSETSKRLFLSCTDILDKLCEQSNEFARLLEIEAVRAMFEQRLSVVCDHVKAGEESMYRLNMMKLLQEIVRKARNAAGSESPSSMEEKFVRTALEVPLLNTQLSRETDPISHGDSASTSVESDSQEADIAPTLSSMTSTSTDLTVPSEMEDEPCVDLTILLRVRTVIAYLISAYVPKSISVSLEDILASNETPINFKPLEERLAYVAKVRAEALASRSLGDFSRKRNAYEEDDAAELRAEKKRKKEEEEKKKKLESRGIKNLRKVDTAGMKKMSDFFGKKVKAK